MKTLERLLCCTYNSIVLVKLLGAIVNGTCTINIMNVTCINARSRNTDFTSE